MCSSDLKYLEKMIKTANVIEDDATDEEVGLSKVVDLYFVEDDMMISYEIVTTMETDAVNNKISIESPLGKMIYKKRLGELVTIDSPDGEYTVRIDQIRKK